MDTVVRDPGVVLHRFKERMNRLVKGSNPIDSAWSAMVKLNYERPDGDAGIDQPRGHLPSPNLRNNVFILL